MERKFTGAKLKVEENNLKDILELMVKENYSNLSVTSFDGLTDFLALKNQNFKTLRAPIQEFSFEEIVIEICNKCSFKYPYIYPQDGKIIWKMDNLEQTFLVNLLSLNGHGTRIEFIRV